MANVQCRRSLICDYFEIEDLKKVKKKSQDLSILHLNISLISSHIKLSASAAASEFCECLQVGIDVYIPHRQYQIKPYLSPWFSAACAAAIVHRNHFFLFVPAA